MRREMGKNKAQQESRWDRLMKIKTTGRDESHADAYCYPYEPTPYCVLERLANSGLIQKKHKILDLIGDFNLTGFNPLNFKAQIIVKEAGHAVHGIVARELKDKLVEI